MSVKHARAVTPKVIDAWIGDVKELFQELGLIKCGRVSNLGFQQLWNCDETTFCTSYTSKKVLARRGGA